MRMKVLSSVGIAVLGLSFAACADTGTNTNYNANANMSTPLTAATPAPTATPKYSEEQAREERARAAQNKETVGNTLEDAWIHTKVVTKLIANSQTPERNINVDVVNAEVTMRGTVDTAEAKTEAERIVKETDGVKKIVNQLKVVPAAKPANANKSKATK